MKNEGLKKTSFKVLCQKFQGVLFVKELQVCRGGDVVPKPFQGLGWMDEPRSESAGPEFRALKLIPLMIPSVFAIKNEISSTLLAPFKVKLCIFLTKTINDE